MPTLKLLTLPDNADRSHRIGSPGGYEFWHFQAEDASQRVRIAVAFHDGFAWHQDYLSRYAAYRRRPTRNSPPTPSQYPCLQINIFENERSQASSTAYFPAGTFQAEDNPSLTLGSNRAVFRDNEIALSLSEPEKNLSIELIFQPALTMHRPIEKSFPADGTGATEHHWIPARPLCNVSGQLRLGGHAIPFAGLGQHNHYYGTGPMFAIASRWVRGSVLFPAPPSYSRPLAGTPSPSPPTIPAPKTSTIPNSPQSGSRALFFTRLIQ